MRSSNLAYAPRRQQQQKQQKPPVIRKSPRSKAGTKRRAMRTAMGLGIYIALASMCLIYGRVRLTEENAALLEATITYEEMQSEYVQMETTIMNMASLKTVEEQARALGLAELQSTQVQNITVHGDNQVHVSGTQGSFLAWWDDLWTYIFG